MREAQAASGGADDLLQWRHARRSITEGRLLGATAASGRTDLQPSDDDGAWIGGTIYDPSSDIGCGHGCTLTRAAGALPDGFVAGVDVSEDMVRMATRRNAALVRSARVEVRRADSCRLPYPNQRFDKVCAVHVLYFWSDPVAHLREIQRVMKPGARLVLGFRPNSDARAVADLPASVYRFYAPDDVMALLGTIGFTSQRAVVPGGTLRQVVFVVAER